MVAVGVVAVCAPAARAQPAADWSQFQADAAHTGAAEGPEPPYEVAWEIAVEPDGQQGLSAPVVSEQLGLVAVVARTEVICVDLATGRRLWSVERSPGPPASPAIVRLAERDLLLYTEGGGGNGPADGASDGPSGTGSGEAKAEPSRLNAIDLETRKPAWETPLGLEASSRSGVAAEGATAFVGDEGGNVVAADVATGEQRWTARVEGSRPALTVAGDRVVLTTAAADTPQPEVVALSATDGKELWRTGTGVAGVLTGVPSANDEAAIVGFADGSVRAFALPDGKQIWESDRLYAGFSPLSAPAIAGADVIAVDIAGGVRRLGGDSGETSWEFELNEAAFRSPPALAGMTVLLSLRDGTIAALDGASGLLVWRSAPGADAAGPIAVGADSFVAVRGGEAAGLAAFRTDAQAPLLREESPTVVRWPEVLAWWAVAAVAVGVVMVVPARVALRNLGPSELDDAGEETEIDDEPTGDEDQA